MAEKLQVLRRLPSGAPTEEQVQGWIKKPPALVLIDLSKKCNLWCDSHCGYPGQQIRREEKLNMGEPVDPLFIDVDTLKSAYQEIATAWQDVPSIQISADGEPLLHPRREEAICYPAKELGLNVGLTTNGTLLSPSLMEKFCQSGVKLVNISLDAATKETYGLVRPERYQRINYFDMVTENIRNAARIRDSFSGQPPELMITMIVRKETEHEQEDFIKLGQDLSVDKVSFRPLNTTAGLTSFFEINAPAGVVTRVNGIDRYPCHFPFTRFSLTVAKEGLKFVYCPHAWDRDSADIGIYPQDGTLKDLWVSSKLEEIRSSHLSGRFNPESLCAACPDWAFVTGKDQIFFADLVK